METMACKFYQIGMCMKGSACSYRHVLIARSPAPVEQHQNPAQVPVCVNFKNGRCKYGDKCKFLHPERSARKQIAQHPAPPPRGAHPGSTKSARARATKQGTEKRPLAQLGDVLKFEGSYRGKQFPASPIEHHYKDVHYHLAEGTATVRLEDGRRTVLPLPSGHTQACFLAGCGLVSYDPGWQVNPSVRVLCDADLTVQPSTARVRLPVELGATKYLVQGTTVVLFKPYTDVDVGREHFRAVSVYRWDARGAGFRHALSWSCEGFHIVRVSATSAHVAISRLPYNPAALEEAHQKEQLHARDQRVIAELTQKVSAFQAAEAQQRLRREAKAREKAEAERMEAQRRERADYYRRLDPMDLFVWDKESRTYTRVFEYTKPVDDLLVAGTRLYVLIDQLTYEFEIRMTPANLHRYRWTKGFRVEAERLTADC